jgi:hypothetical protein
MGKFSHRFQEIFGKRFRQRGVTFVNQNTGFVAFKAQGPAPAQPAGYIPEEHGYANHGFVAGAVAPGVDQDLEPVGFKHDKGRGIFQEPVDFVGEEGLLPEAGSGVLIGLALKLLYYGHILNHDFRGGFYAAGGHYYGIEQYF